MVQWLIFGDSHVAAFERAAELGWIRNPSAFLSVGGATAVGMRNPNSATNALQTFREALLPVRPGCIPVMHLGEVDCGFVIWYRALKYNESVEAQLAASLAAHIEFVDQLLAAGYPTVVLTGASMPTIGDGEVSGDVANKRSEISVTRRDRTQLTQTYNARLRELAAARGVPFIDIADMVIDPDTGEINPIFCHNDPGNHHLHPERSGRVWASRLNELAETLMAPGGR